MIELDTPINELSRQIVGAAIEAHRVLGPGFLEFTYEEAMAIELTLRGIPYTSQVPVPVIYKGHPVGQGRLDLLVSDTIIVELKAVEVLAPIHSVQLLSYLRATGHKLGLLINFNVPLLKEGIKRIINSQP